MNRWRSPLPVGWKATAVIVGIAVVAAYWVLSPIPPTSDVRGYWQADLSNLYRLRWGELDAYVYSPAFAQLISPLTYLPFDIFYKIVQAVNLVALVWLLSPGAAAASLALPPVNAELQTGQIHLLLAVMVVLGVRHPSVWSFGILTKVSPGVALVSWLARHQVKHVALALAATSALTAVSVMLAPDQWLAWIQLLAESSTRHVTNYAVSEWPAILRLPIAAGLAIAAGWRDRPAALPAIVLFSLPVIWFAALVMLLAIPRLLGSTFRPSVVQ